MSYLITTRGDDDVFDVAVTDEDTGLPVDLSGADLTFMVKRYPSDPDADALITKVTPTEVAITLPATGGLAVVTLDAADTDDLAPGNYSWELQVVDAANKVRTVAGGRFKIVADLIRAGA